MLMENPTEEIIIEWKNIYDKYKDKIKPNKKDGLEIIQYLQKHHSTIEIKNQEL